MVILAFIYLLTFKKNNLTRVLTTAKYGVLLYGFQLSLIIFFHIAGSKNIAYLQHILKANYRLASVLKSLRKYPLLGLLELREQIVILRGVLFPYRKLIEPRIVDKMNIEHIS